jgi:hypothetical protein
MAEAFPRDMQSVGKQAVDALGTEPPKWRGKRRWNSLRQMRAYFATDGFGAGIPYRRTHDLARRWRYSATADERGGQLVVSNPSRKATFVQGPRAQLMHLDSGWPQLVPTAKPLQAPAQKRALARWSMLTSGTGAGIIHITGGP